MIAFLFSALLASATPGEPAPSPAPSSEVDPARLEAARALIAALDFDKQLEQTTRLSVEATFDPVMDTIAKQHGIKIPDDLRERARRLVAEHSATVVRAMIEGGAADQAARVYARYFTADELQQLRNFQTHPVVIKANRLAPGLMAELGQIGTVTAAEHTVELISKLKSMMQAWVEEQQAAERDPA